jgi:hypothetical protein
MTAKELQTKIYEELDSIDIRNEHELRMFIKRSVNFTASRMKMPVSMAAKTVYSIMVSYKEKNYGKTS